MLDKFAIFICTHGRPHAQYTYKKLITSGYTGKIYFLLDNEDSTILEYIETYGKEKIYIFNKQEYILKTDTFTSTENIPTKCVVYARNAAFDIAKKLKLDSFAVADDDISSLRYRYIENDSLRSCEITSNMNYVIFQYIKFLLDNKLDCVSFGVASEYFGGVDLFIKNANSARTCHNFMFIRTDASWRWMSAFLEDIATSIVYGKIGKIFLPVLSIQLNNMPLGVKAGGMHDTYKELPEFRRCWYAFMCSPTSVRVYKSKNKWKIGVIKKCAVPKIVSDLYRRETE